VDVDVEPAGDAADCSDSGKDKQLQGIVGIFHLESSPGFEVIKSFLIFDKDT
jgi:hypothetical protein